MKKILTSIVLAASLSFSAQAQDEAIFSHYLFNPMLVNPAYAGFNDNVQIFGHLRSQWAGFEGAPKTYALTMDLPVNEKVGLGGLLLSEKFGVMNRLRGQLNYAYRYVGKGIKWSVGFSTEFHKSRMDASINDLDVNPLVDRNDPLVMERIKGTTFFDASFGGTVLIDEKIILSASTPNLIRARIGEVDPVKSQRTFLRQFIVMAGYRVKKNQLTIEPSLQIRKVYQAPFEVDLNVKVNALEDKLVTGFTVRPGTSGQIGLFVGTKQPGFQIYYSYNSSLSEFKAYNRTAHEVTLGIEIKKPEKKIDRGSKRYRN
jgi:type IX secretion system PorP/SprF family membrane protein